MRYKPYTKSEFVFIAKNYPRLGLQRLANRLQRTPGSLSVTVTKLRQAGVKIERPHGNPFEEAVKVLTK